MPMAYSASKRSTKLLKAMVEARKDKLLYVGLLFTTSPNAPRYLPLLNSLDLDDMCLPPPGRGYASTVMRSVIDIVSFSSQKNPTRAPRMTRHTAKIVVSGCSRLTPATSRSITSTVSRQWETSHLVMRIPAGTSHLSLSQ